MIYLAIALGIFLVAAGLAFINENPKENASNH
jgi:hypothetical protein